MLLADIWKQSLASSTEMSHFSHKQKDLYARSILCANIYIDSDCKAP